MRHSGLEFERMVNNHQKPTAREVKTIIDEIRPLFNETMPVLAGAILKEKFTAALNDAE